VFHIYFSRINANLDALVVLAVKSTLEAPALEIQPVEEEPVNGFQDYLVSNECLNEGKSVFWIIFVPQAASMVFCQLLFYFGYF
jgi:hypothetical protein